MPKNKDKQPTSRVDTVPGQPMASSGQMWFEYPKPTPAPVLPQPLFPPVGTSPPNVIGPLDKAGPGWKAETIPAKPEDWERPGYTGETKI